MFKVAVVSGSVIEAMQTTSARGYFVQTVLAHFVDIFRIDAERPVHDEEIDLAFFNGLIEQIRSLCRIVICRAANRNAHGSLDFGCNVQVQTNTGVVSANQALEVLVKINALAIAVEAFKATAGKVQISSELCDVLAAGSYTDMQAVGTGCLHLLCNFNGFLNGAVLIVIAQIPIILFNTVNQDLDDKVFSALLLQPADYFFSKLAAAVDCLRTVFIGTVVTCSGEEGLAKVICGEVQFKSIKTVFLKFLADSDNVLNPLFNGCGVIVAQEGFGKVQRPDRGAHGIKLIADCSASSMQGIHQTLHIIFFQRSLERTAAGDFPNVREIFDPDHLNSAVSHPFIIIDVFIRISAEEGKLKCRGFDHTMVKRVPAKLPVREERSLGQIFAGIAVKVSILGVNDSSTFNRFRDHNSKSLSTACIDTVTDSRAGKSCTRNTINVCRRTSFNNPLAVVFHCQFHLDEVVIFGGFQHLVADIGDSAF